MELTKDNMARMLGILLPPSPEILALYARQGFDDCLRFLQSRNMISCTRCMGVSTSYTLGEYIF